MSINVLSCFDGMSCGQESLKQLGIPVRKYYSSELDKYAIAVAQHNHPDTIQVGDVTNWRDWDIDWSTIDLIFGGSPCQGFSFAGKQLAFDDPRSKLFFVFVDIINHIKKVNPNVKFLLENVRMKKEYLDIISEYIGVQPVKINSALVSAQNRVRYYWTNIAELDQPEDRSILLKDILEDEVEIKHFYSNEQKSKMQLSETNQNKDIKIIAHRKGYRRNSQIFDSNGKTESIDTAQGGGRVIGTQIVKLGNVNPSGRGMNGEVYGLNGKALTVTTNKGEGSKISKLEKHQWRKLTPLEYERLQTVPDNYTLVPWQKRMMSNSQRYKMLGNGWTIEVIKHIFKELISFK